MKRVISIQAIRRIIKEELEAQAPVDAPLGQYAWPSKRDDIESDEKDTDVEKELYKQLNYHFNFSSEPLAKKWTNLIKNMMVNGYYTKVLCPPTEEFVYKGMIISKDLVSQFSGLPMNSLLLDVERYMPSSFLLEPLQSRGAMSFTYNKTIASRFANKTPDSKDSIYRVIIKAKASDNIGNLLDGTSLTSKVQGLNSLFDDEAEVVSLGPVNCCGIMWMPDPKQKLDLQDIKNYAYSLTEL